MTVRLAINTETGTLDLTPYLAAESGAGMEPGDPKFTNKVFAHSLLKPGGTLALEDLQLKEMVFPLKLHASNKHETLELVEELNTRINMPGAQIEWQDEGVEQPTYFDLASGQFDDEYDFRLGEHNWLKGKLRLFVQPLGYFSKLGPRAMTVQVNEPFSNLTITDSFKRAPENPLTNPNSFWIKPPLAGILATNTTVVSTGHIAEAAGKQYWTSEGEVSNPSKSCGAIWTEEPIADRLAVSVEYEEAPAGVGGVQLLANWNLTGGGYRGFINLGEIRIQRQPDGANLAIGAGVTLNAGDVVGMDVVSGLVSLWRKPSGGTWKLLLEVRDTTYTRGYGGFITEVPVKLNNFAVDELPHPTAVTRAVGTAPIVTFQGSGALRGDANALAQCLIAQATGGNIGAMYSAFSVLPGASYAPFIGGPSSMIVNRFVMKPSPAYAFNAEAPGATAVKVVNPNTRQYFMYEVTNAAKYCYVGEQRLLMAARKVSPSNTTSPVTARAYSEGTGEWFGASQAVESTNWRLYDMGVPRNASSMFYRGDPYLWNVGLFSHGGSAAIEVGGFVQLPDYSTVWFSGENMPASTEGLANPYTGDSVRPESGIAFDALTNTFTVGGYLGVPGSGISPSAPAYPVGAAYNVANLTQWTRGAIPVVPVSKLSPVIAALLAYSDGPGMNFAVTVTANVLERCRYAFS